MRALAVLGVLVHHVALQLQPFGEPASVWAGWARGLNLGVTIFFLISGFLLYRPYVAARVLGSPPPGLARFWRRRALRILPAYWVAITLLALYPGLSGVWSGEWWKYYGLVQGYWRNSIFQGIPVTWSLCVEVTFYALLPLWAVAIARLVSPVRRKGGLVAELLPLALLGLGSLCYFVLSTGGASRAAVSHLAYRFPADLDWFVLGMVLAVLTVWRERGPDSWQIPWPRIASAGCWLSAAVIFLASFRHTAGFAREHVTDAVVALLMMLPAVFAERTQGLPQWLLGRRPVAFLGLISYGVYLYHSIIIRWLHGQGVGTANRLGDFVVLSVSALALSVLVAYASYRLVELPFLRMKNRT